MTSKWEKKSAAELKAILKGFGMTQAGDKGTLIHRIELHEKCSNQHLAVEDGRSPCELNITDLKRYVARAGLSPIGTADELLTSLVGHLSSSTSKASTASDSQQPASQGPSDIEIAKRVIELDESDDYLGILNIAGAGSITSTSPVAVLRKAYLKLSILIHPDKLQRKFDQATKAFQALVRAFERLSAPDVEDDIFMSEEAGGGRKGGVGKKGATATPAISRSNEGCYRTRVRCPRCKEAWSEGGLDGNPEYFYNFMMTGLKTYTCSTCLCEFGCVTALHNCPHCNKFYDYSPQDYHRKIQCGNKGCSREFGFYMFHVSPRMMTEIKMSVKKDQEELLKARRAKERRAARSSRGVELNQRERERAFVMGLEDCCPRCGESFEGYPDEESQSLHLMNCTDDIKHKKHKADKQVAADRAAAVESRQERQAAAQAMAAWEFLGAKSSQLYLLDDNHLEDIAIREGALVSAADECLRITNDDGGGGKKRTKSALVEQIATNRRKQSGEAVVVVLDGHEDSRPKKKGRSTTASSASTEVVVKVKRIRVSAEDMPENMHRMSVAELELFCASYGIRVPSGACKSEIIDTIEDLVFEGLDD